MKMFFHIILIFMELMKLKLKIIMITMNWLKMIKIY